MKYKIFSLISFLIAVSTTACQAQLARIDERKKNGIGKIAAMQTSRAAHTATMLADGRILIAGGFDENKKSQAGAEIFDPRTNKFSTLEEMNFARAGHTATLLQDGKVLIAGGFTDGNYLDSAEIFDPQTNRFTRVGKLTMPRSEHTAVSLDDGKVLLAGGVGTNYKFLDSAEIFDARTQTFSAVGKMTTARESHTAIKLRDGRVLIAGGHRGRRAQMQVYAGTEIFDPAKNEFVKSADLIVRRHKHGAVLLADGKVLIAGGADERDARGAYQTAEIFDPAKNLFTKTADMNLPRYKLNGAIVSLKDGKILIAGGANRAEIFDPAKNTFALANGGFDSSRLFSTATLLRNGKVLIVGGYDQNNEVSKQAWIFDAN